MDAFTDHVRALLVSETGVRAAKVTEDARLLKDLPVDGDGLADLMQAYLERLAVDPVGFDANLYLPDESSSLFGRARKTLPITVAMLVDGARSGRWPELS